MKKRSSLWLLLLTALALQSCSYSGDGIFQAKGILLRNCLLTLPTFSLDKQATYHYDIKGFSCFNTYMYPYLIIESLQPIPFWQLTTLIEFTIREKKSDEIFIRKTSQLNSHYHRMLKYNEGLNPNINEWMGYYKFPTKQNNYRAVPFSNIEYPLKQNIITFVHGQYLPSIKWYKSYVLTVRILEPDPNFKGLSAHIQLSSGWK